MAVRFTTGVIAELYAYVVNDFQAVPLGELGTTNALPGWVAAGACSFGTAVFGQT